MVMNVFVLLDILSNNSKIQPAINSTIAINKTTSKMNFAFYMLLSFD